jgi:hypothetical protein
MMNKFRFVFSLILMATLAWGCSDNPVEDPGPQPDTGLPDADNNDDGYPDVDVWAEGRSDDFDSATPFEPGQTLGGVIEEGSGEDYDLDMFAVELEAGTVFSFGFTELGPGLMNDGQPMVFAVLQDEEGDVVRYLDSSVRMDREVFIPLTGTYYLAILDVRAGQQAHGGATSYYAMTTGVRALTTESASAPGTVTGDMADGKVKAFEVTTSEGGVLIAETIATRPPVESDLDTVLFGWDVAANALVAYNDDIDGQSGIYDSQIVMGAEPGKTFVVIVDAYDAAEDAAFNLVLSFSDDHPSYPRDLEVGATVDAQINEAVGGESDVDYFWVELEPGQVVRAEIEAADQLNPVLLVYDGWGTFLGAAVSVEKRAAMVFSHDADDEESAGFYVIVSDRRNIALEQGEVDQQVGGAGFGYTLSVTATEWTSRDEQFPVEGQGVLDDVGQFELYNLEVPAGALVHLKARSDAAGFSPYVGLVFGNAIDFFTEGPLTYVHGDETQSVRFGVRDQYHRGGAGYEYTCMFRVFDPADVTFETVTSDGAANAASAQEIPADATIAGTLAGASTTNVGAHYFKLSGLEAGHIVVVRTRGGDGTDTIARLLNADGTVLVENDDYFGQARSLDSAFVFDVTEAGDYFITVTPFCTSRATDGCEGNGPYSLQVFNGQVELVVE